MSEKGCEYNFMGICEYDSKVGVQCTVDPKDCNLLKKHGHKIVQLLIKKLDWNMSMEEVQDAIEVINEYLSKEN